LLRVDIPFGTTLEELSAMNKFIKILPLFLVVVLLAILFLVAFWVSVYMSEFSKSDVIIELLKISLATSAFVIALYTLFSKDTRLRANGENILVALILFIISNILLILSYVLSIASCSMHRITIAVTIAALLMYCGSFIFLFKIFLNAYNQIYNLRTNKFIKYFKPIRIILDAVRPYKHYETQSEGRETDQDSFQVLRPHLLNHEIEELARGGSILITGPPQRGLLDPVFSLMHERLIKGNETINFVCTDQHPYRLWERFKSTFSIPQEKHKDIVFIDAYSPSYSFFEDIQQENSRLLSLEGIECVKAKSFSGLHTAMTKAWNIIKSKEEQTGRGNRRPMIAIYAHTSGLCEFESTEQFRIFWWHVIPSEKSYKIITVIIEDDLSGEVILNCLKQRVDCVLKVEAACPTTDRGTQIQISRIK
jgi:hypothetical protein